MLPKIHAQITREALREQCSQAALEQMISANLHQDRLSAQLGHDEFHFDNNAFDKSLAYIEEQRRQVISSLQAMNPPAAWAAFGRLTHTAQDFYAHSNYVDLWHSSQPAGTVPAAADIDPLAEELLHSRALRSGKLYYPLEVLSFIKFLKPVILPLLPRDSHAWMNLDSPDRGPKFSFAYHAAVKRTRSEFEKTTAGMASELVNAFTGR